MMRILIVVLAVLFIGIMLVIGYAPAEGAEVQDTPGVIANERVINLPNDNEKWYLSVVGEYGEARYAEILVWFEKDSALNHLKKQVHFRRIDSDTATYRGRYKSNVKGLPTVRLQKHNGAVVYEAADSQLPLSSDGLYGALANASRKAQGLGIFSPWRRRQDPCPDNRCPVRPVDPPPQEDPLLAPIDDGGAPEIAAKSGFDMISAGIGAGSVLLCLFSGTVVSLLVQWKRMYRK